MNFCAPTGAKAPGHRMLRTVHPPDVYCPKLGIIKFRSPEGRACLREASPVSLLPGSAR
jgi:hypothetical protein